MKGHKAASKVENAVLRVNRRAGHSHLLIPLGRKYANMGDKGAPRLNGTTLNTFGSPSPPLNGITANPEIVLALTKAPPETSW